jgi:antirestriction protein ArdC
MSDEHQPLSTSIDPQVRGDIRDITPATVLNGAAVALDRTDSDIARVQTTERSESSSRSSPNGPHSTDRRLSRDLRQEITDRMAGALEQGTIPWEKPWHELKAGRPQNLQSARDYRGGNRFLLMLVQLEKGYADPRFGTLRQVNRLGGAVNKGEKGCQIEFWDNQPFYQRRDVLVYHAGEAVKVIGESRHGVVIRPASAFAADPKTVTSWDFSVRHEGEVLNWRDAHQKLDRMVSRISTVFNVQQCRDLKLEPLEPVVKTQIPTIERAERLIASMRGDGLQFATDNRSAYYVPRNDTVYLPERERFASCEGYYGTALHEIGHATGAARRLNREGITGEHGFGTEPYAREELRAELFSVFMAAETGIPHDESQHRAYIQSWGKILRADKHEIFRAADEAGNAVEYVFQTEQALTHVPEIAVEHQPEPATQQDANSQTERVAAREPSAAKAERSDEPRRSYARRRGLER